MAYPDSNALAPLLDSLAALAEIDLPDASRAGVCEHLATAGRMAAMLEAMPQDDHELALAPVFHAGVTPAQDADTP